MKPVACLLQYRLLRSPALVADSGALEVRLKSTSNSLGLLPPQQLQLHACKHYSEPLKQTDSSPLMLILQESCFVCMPIYAFTDMLKFL